MKSAGQARFNKKSLETHMEKYY